MSLIGLPPDFYSRDSTWASFIEQLELYFDLNNLFLDDRKKAALLLMQIDVQTYDFLQMICLPASPNSKSFDELCELIRKYSFESKPLAWHEKRVFYNITQAKDDSVGAFLERIQCQARKCHFKHELESILLDRFISGLRSVDIIDKIDEMDAKLLTLDVVVKIALQAEVLAKETQVENVEI